MKKRVFSCPRNIHHAPLKIATTTPIVKKLSRKLTIVMPATLFIISEQNIHQFITFNFESCCYPKIPQYQRLAHIQSVRRIVLHVPRSERRGSVVVSTSAWHAAGRWFDSQTRHVSLLGVKTWLSTLEIVYLCVFRRRH